MGLCGFSHRPTTTVRPIKMSLEQSKSPSHAATSVGLGAQTHLNEPSTSGGGRPPSFLVPFGLALGRFPPTLDKVHGITAQPQWHVKGVTRQNVPKQRTTTPTTMATSKTMSHQHSAALADHGNIHAVATQHSLTSPEVLSLSLGATRSNLYDVLFH